MNVHKVVATNQMPVVGFTVFQLHQLERGFIEVRRRFVVVFITYHRVIHRRTKKCQRKLKENNRWTVLLAMSIRLRSLTI